MRNEQEKDLARFVSIVREFHRQDANHPISRRQGYADACDALQDEIGEERLQAARYEYDERQFRQAEAAEDAWIDSQR